MQTTEASPTEWVQTCTIAAKYLDSTLQVCVHEGKFLLKMQSCQVALSVREQHLGWSGMWPANAIGGAVRSGCHAGVVHVDGGRAHAAVMIHRRCRHLVGAHLGRAHRPAPRRRAAACIQRSSSSHAHAHAGHSPTGPTLMRLIAKACTQVITACSMTRMPDICKSLEVRRHPTKYISPI